MHTTLQDAQAVDYQPMLLLTAPWQENGLPGVCEALYTDRVAWFGTSSAVVKTRPFAWTYVDRSLHTFIVRVDSCLGSKDAPPKTAVLYQYAKDGQLERRLQLPLGGATLAIPAFAVEGGYLYLLDGVEQGSGGIAARLRKIDLDSGISQWTILLEDFPKGFDNLVVHPHGTPYLVFRSGLVIEIAPDTGQIARSWSLEIDENLRNARIAANGTLYVTTSSLLSCDLRSGKCARLFEKRGCGEFLGVDDAGNAYFVGEGLVDRVSPDGSLARYRLEGVVAQQGIWISFWNEEKQELTVKHWDIGGRYLQSVTLHPPENSIFAGVPRIVHTDGESLYVYDGTTLYRYSPDGQFEAMQSLGAQFPPDQAQNETDYLSPIHSYAMLHPGGPAVDRSGRLYVPVAAPEGLQLLRFSLNITQSGP